MDKINVYDKLIMWN